ncbi:MAG: VanW family protein [Paludibacteraceae bacterium]|nr:VanW family protein [Paludibacteraceae bacterium]
MPKKNNTKDQEAQHKDKEKQISGWGLPGFNRYGVSLMRKFKDLNLPELGEEEAGSDSDSDDSDEADDSDSDEVDEVNDSDDSDEADEIHVKAPKTIYKKIKSIKTHNIKLVGPIKNYYILFLGLLLIISAYHIYYARKMIPGVSIAGMDVGGLTYNQALQKLKDKEISTIKNIQLVYEGRAYELKAEDIDLLYNWEATVSRAFEVGRTGVFYTDAKDKIAGIFRSLYIPSYYDFSEERFDNFLAQVRGDLNQLEVDANYVIQNDTELYITEESVGKKVDDELLYNNLIKGFDTYNFSPQKIVVEPSEPKVTAKDLSKLLDEAQKIVFNPLELVYKESVVGLTDDDSDGLSVKTKVSSKDLTWKLTPEEMLEFLTYEPDKKQLGFNKAVFKVYLEEITPEVNKLPKGKVEDNGDGKVIGFELTEDGVELNVDETTEAFKTAYFELKNTSEIAVDKISGPVDPKSYGIVALVGEGKSKFTGSARGRINNLTLAASRTDGVLVAPGAVYSFNDTIGPVTAETGYDAAWVILGSRTVMGHGGGVCQTSTTMFRAILNSGLPVVTRHPHAYRVYYYELESQLGVDASVYQPSLDLKFKNDLESYILIQAGWNLEDSSLWFKFYGTPDGRKVEISDSVVTNQSPPPEPVYQEDDTLTKGVIRQVDFAASGASVSFTRKVTRDDEVLYEDTFRTNYQPWRAVYLVGTKE